MTPLESFAAQWTVFPLHGISRDAAGAPSCACSDPSCAMAGKHPMVKWSLLAAGAKVLEPGGTGYGIATGARSGFFVVDLDSDEALAEFERLHGGPCPLTFTVKTPRGWHLYFTYPGFHVPNSAGVLGRGIDVRGDGGMVVALGSPHKSGLIYEAPIFADVAPAPAWLLEWLQAPKKTTTPTQGFRDVSETPTPTATVDPLDTAARLLAVVWPPRGARCGARLGLAGTCATRGVAENDAAELARRVHAHLDDRGGVTDQELDAIVSTAYARTARGEPVAVLAHHVSSPAIADAAIGQLPSEAAWVQGSVERQKASTPAGAPLVQPATTFTPVAWGGWSATPKPPVYLLDGLIPEEKTATWYAEGGSVKSWAAFALAISVATGLPWLGRYRVKQGRALILDYEDGLWEFLRRRWILAKGLRGPYDPELPHLGYRYCGPHIADPALWRELEQLRPTLVVVDALASGMPGDVDENDNSAFAEGLKLAGRFTTATGCTVLAIHHANKTGGMRGASAIRDQSDVVFRFEGVSETDELKRMRMICDKPGPQKRPAPVNIELTDNGLGTFEDAPAGSQDDPASLIKLVIGGRDDIKGYRKLQALTNLPERTVKRELRILVEDGEVYKGVGGVLCLRSS